MSGRDNPFGDIERLFEQMSGQFGAAREAPAVDVVDEGDAFVLRADLPGYDPDDVDLQVSGDRTVRIEAGRRSEAEEREGRYVRRERRRERTSRSVTLPEPVATAAAEAGYDAGVLTVTLPKQTAAEGTDIPVG